MRYSKIFALAFVLIFSISLLCACTQTPNEQGSEVASTSDSVVTVSDVDVVLSASDSETADDTPEEVDLEVLNGQLLQGEFEFYIGEGKVEITGYRGNAEYIEIPYGVTHIGDFAFSCQTSILEVTLPESITSIGSKAFEYCLSLSKINLPNTITYIGSEAFVRCYKLTLSDPALPSGLTTIYFGTFSDCREITEIIVPEGVTEIGVSAFGGCVKLKQVSLPSTLRNIYACAFANCAIEELIIPNGVESIYAVAFSSSHLTRVVLPSSLKYIYLLAFGEPYYAKGITIVCAEGSAAYEYAMAVGHPIEIDNTL